jgi:hypothetical protein
MNLASKAISSIEWSFLLAFQMIDLKTIEKIKDGFL